MKSIEQQFLELREGLYKPLLFFIPKSIFTGDILNSLTQEVKHELLDTLMLIKEDGSCYKLNTGPVLFYILQKKNNLDDSILKIFEIKKQLEEREFSFFIQRYLTEVDVYVYLTEWLYTNRGLYKELLSEEQVQSLYLQQEYLKQHLEALKQHCLKVNSPVKKEKESILNFLKKEIPELEQVISKARLNEIDLPEQKKSTTKLTLVAQENKNENKKQKPERITEKEAEDFLLESVFNVKIKNRKNG